MGTFEHPDDVRPLRVGGVFGIRMKRDSIKIQIAHRLPFVVWADIGADIGPIYGADIGPIHRPDIGYFF